jgi:hypothetical protein
MKNYESSVVNECTLLFKMLSEIIGHVAIHPKSIVIIQFSSPVSSRGLSPLSLFSLHHSPVLLLVPWAPYSSQLVHLLSACKVDDERYSRPPMVEPVLAHIGMVNSFRSAVLEAVQELGRTGEVEESWATARATDIQVATPDTSLVVEDTGH